MAHQYHGCYILIPETLPDNCPLPQAPREFLAFWAALRPAVDKLIAAAPLKPTVQPSKLAERLLQYLLATSPKYGCPRYLSWNHPSSYASNYATRSSF